MRITCPNCAAEYEVDATLVPEDGRDVQCSACGHTWMQFRDGRTEEVGAPHSVPGPDPEPASTPSGQADSLEAATRPPRRELDEETRQILREEAEREAARRRERRETKIETQTEMGLDRTPSSTRSPAPKNAVPDGEDAVAALGALPSKDEPKTADRTAASRGESFPDIEEINSTLGPGKTAPNAATSDAALGQRKSSSFRRGFLSMLLVGAVLILLYVLAPNLSQALPAIEPELASYVGAVNAFRAGVEETLQSAALWLQDLTGA